MTTFGNKVSEELSSFIQFRDYLHKIQDDVKGRKKQQKRLKCQWNQKVVCFIIKHQLYLKNNNYYFILISDVTFMEK